MRNTTIKTSVTYSNITATIYNTETKEVKEIVLNIPATAKTTKGIEKIILEEMPQVKVLEIAKVDKCQKWYELDRETFMKYAKEVEK